MATTSTTVLRAIYALSLTQPWASLMALGLKRIETRSWRPRYTGPIAIQAARGFDQEDQLLCEVEPFRSALLTDSTLDPDKPLAPQLPRGSVLAFARLDSSEQVLPGIHLPGEPERTFGNYAIGRYMLHFSHLHRLAEPCEAVGGLNYPQYSFGLALALL